MNITGGIVGKIYPIANMNNEEDTKDFNKFIKYLYENKFVDFDFFDWSGIRYIFIKPEHQETWNELTKNYKY